MTASSVLNPEPWFKVPSITNLILFQLHFLGLLVPGNLLAPHQFCQNYECYDNEPLQVSLGCDQGTAEHKFRKFKPYK